MNETLGLIADRRSARAFEEKEITPEDKRAILDAAKRAPTAGNMMLYSILDITDQKIKNRLAVTCDNQPFIATAKMLLIFVADYSRWYNKYKSLCKDEIIRPLGMGDLLIACQDTMAAAQTAVIAAQSLGICSCYIGDILENWEIHQELLGLPAGTVPLSMLVFGHPTEKLRQRNKTDRFDDEFCIFENRYHVLSESELRRFYTSEDENESEKVHRLFKRKYSADYSIEMNRSAEEIIKNWTK